MAFVVFVSSHLVFPEVLLTVVMLVAETESGSHRNVNEPDWPFCLCLLTKPQDVNSLEQDEDLKRHAEMAFVVSFNQWYEWVPVGGVQSQRCVVTAAMSASPQSSHFPGKAQKSTSKIANWWHEIRFSQSSMLTIM